MEIRKAEPGKYEAGEIQPSLPKYAGSRYCRADRRRSDPHHCRTVENSLLAMQRTVDVNYNLLRLQLGLQARDSDHPADQLDNFLKSVIS